MPKRLLAFGIALVVGASAAQAGERTVYRGRLGTQDVVLELERNGDQYDGRYFYQRIGVNIPLRGAANALAEALPLYDRELQHTIAEDGPVFVDPHLGASTQIWNGRIEGTRYAGTWRDVRRQRSIAFSLQRVATYTTNLPMEKSWEWMEEVSVDSQITMARTPYTYLRMHEARLTEGEEVVFGNVAYRMVTDPRTKFPYPRLTRHPDARVLARSNAFLEQRHWSMNQEALECVGTLYTNTGPSAGTLAEFDNENIRVTFLSPTLMSIVQSGGNGCGGAHPNNHFDPITLDLLHGGLFDFNRLLDAYGPANQYGTRPLTRRFQAFVEARARQALKGADVEPECAGMLTEYLSLYFVENGDLAFAISGIGHAMSICLGTMTSVPLSTLGPLRRPGARAYFPNLR